MCSHQLISIKLSSLCCLQRKNSQFSNQQEKQQKASTHVSSVLILLFSALPFPHTTLTPALDSDAKPATVAKAQAFHSITRPVPSVLHSILWCMFIMLKHTNLLLCTVTCRWNLKLEFLLISWVSCAPRSTGIPAHHHLTCSFFVYGSPSARVHQRYKIAFHKSISI